MSDLSMSKSSSPDLLSRVTKLITLHKSGALGGERMPEDANPNLARSSKENFLYLTLPMSLNFQRNSYKLWEAALLTFNDKNTKFVFDPYAVVDATEGDVRDALLKYKVALQPNKHVEIWRRISGTLCNKYRGDVRVFLQEHDHRIGQILNTFRTTGKPDFPYLSGPKIGNYWLYVLLQYTDAPLTEKEHLSVAPDTHVIQASMKLGVIEAVTGNLSSEDIAIRWSEALSGTGIHPIDVHTPMWLWSRRNFDPHV